MRPWRTVLALAVALSAASAAPAEDAPNSVLVESGERSYQRYCSACHGLDGRGQGPVAPVLRTPPADLTRIAARRGGVFPDFEIAGYVDGRADVAAHGSREMPVWGRIFARPVVQDSTGEEVARGQLFVLVEYLKTLQRPAP